MSSTANGFCRSSLMLMVTLSTLKQDLLTEPEVRREFFGAFGAFALVIKIVVCIYFFALKLAWTTTESWRRSNGLRKGFAP